MGQGPHVSLLFLLVLDLCVLRTRLFFARAVRQQSTLLWLYHRVAPFAARVCPRCWQEVREFQGAGVVATYTLFPSVLEPGAWVMRASVSAVTDASTATWLLRSVRASSSLRVSVAGAASSGKLVDVSANAVAHPAGLSG